MYTPHWLAAFGGTANLAGTGDEIWACTLRLFGTDTATDALPYQEEVAPLLATWFSSAGAKMANTAHLTYLKINAVDADGRYVLPTTNVHDYTTVVAGSGAPTVPSYLSVCYSWGSSIKKRGPASHGRMYPPNYTYAISPAGGSAILGTDQTAAVAAAKALLTVFVDGAGSHGDQVPGMFSNVGAAFETIDTVRVGNIYDRMSSRRNALPETYVQASFP